MVAVPLMPEGVAATRAFLDAGAFGPRPRRFVNRALAAAARRAGRPGFTTYQIRHSFAAGLHRAGTDVADIHDLYGHTRPGTTMIYMSPEREETPRGARTAPPRRRSAHTVPGWPARASLVRPTGRTAHD